MCKCDHGKAILVVIVFQVGITLYKDAFIKRCIL